MVVRKKERAARRGRPPKNERQAEVERARILAAAERLFAKGGYEGVSMRAVAGATGCSLGALYNLFPHKRALLRNIWEDAFIALDRALARAEDGRSDPVDRLKLLGLAYVRFWVARPDHFRALFLIEDRVDKPGERYFVQTSASLPRVVAQFMAAAESAIAARGSTLKPREAVELIFCALHGVASAIIGAPEYRWGNAEQLSERMMEIMVRGALGT
jgi:AcrR family transcriptional regulator